MTTKEEYTYSPVAEPENSEVTFITKNNGKSNTRNLEPINRKFLYVATCVGDLSAFVCGTSLGWTSPEIPKLTAPLQNDNPLPEPLTKSEESWIGSLLPVGAILGPFIAGALADRIGRKKTILIGTLPFILAYLLASFASSTLEFYLVRFLCGLGVGMIFTVLPMYVGEIAEDAVRDTLGSFMQLFIVIGFLFSYCFGPYTSISVFNIMCVVVPSLFLVVFYIFIPESPYYLIRTNKDQAQKALMKLRAKSEDEVQTELVKIKDNVDEALANKASFMDIFKSKALTKAFTITLGIIALQQFSGINCVLFYAQDIFTDAGSTIPPEICTIIIGIVQVIGCATTPIIVEKKGKRFLLILSAIGMALSLAMLAVFFYLKNSGRDVSSIGWLPVTSLISFIVAFCVGFGPLPFAVMGEMFPSNIKSAASTAIAASSWFVGFFLTKYFGLVSKLIGQAGSFGLFAVCCIGAAGFVYKYLPDTSGKSLQEIQDILSGKNVSKKADSRI